MKQKETLLTKFKKKIIFLLLFSSLIFLFILSNCYQINIIKEDNPIEENYLIIKIYESSFTLSWDSPCDASPDSYRIYYKPHNSLIWKFLNELPADITFEYEINYTDLDNENIHDFGVTAIYNETESEPHYSLEASACPSTGWYVEWVL
ncbi:MAG: fibronectin type III domain-containing protein [Spirochaetes bacterium]|nr:fibronectin type III domain-containing protein [Spirochaetota bacterium]